MCEIDMRCRAPLWAAARLACMEIGAEDDRVGFNCVDRSDRFLLSRFGTSMIASAVVQMTREAKGASNLRQ
jgi:hypothetical protein